MEVLNKVKDYIKNYIKNNKLYVFVMVIGFIAFCIQTKFVVLYADDIVLGYIAKSGGFIDALKYLGHNYMNWGGGPTPFIAVLFLKFPLRVWKLFSCILMFLIIAISTKLIHYMSKMNKGIIAGLLWVFLFILSITIARESVYWLDGHLAYVLTSFQLLLYFYYLHSRLIMNVEIKKYDYVLLPLVAFFSGWTGPQAAVLTVFISILLVLWKKIINKEKIPTLIKVSIGFGILGCLVEVLAPGNSIRMAQFHEFSQYSIVEKIGYRIDDVYKLIFDFTNEYGLGSLAFFMYLAFGMLAIIAFKFANKEENTKLRNIVKGTSVTLIGYICMVALIKLNLLGESSLVKMLVFKDLLSEYNNGSLSIKMLIPYAVSSIIMLIVCLLALYISIKKKNCMLFTVIISALIAQGIMVVSPYTPARATLCSIFLLWIGIIYLIQLAEEERIDLIYIIIITLAMIQKELALVGVIIYFTVNSLFKEHSKKQLIIILAIFGVFALDNWITVTKNYKDNEQIYYENIGRIEAFVKNNPQGSSLRLLDPYDERYGFTKFIGSDWIEKSVKKYFGINPNVELIEEKIEQGE